MSTICVQMSTSEEKQTPQTVLVFWVSESNRRQSACVAPGPSDVQKPWLPACGSAGTWQLRIFQQLCWPLPEYCHKPLMEGFLRNKTQSQSANNICPRNRCFALMLMSVLEWRISLEWGTWSRLLLPAPKVGVDTPGKSKTPPSPPKAVSQTATSIYMSWKRLDNRTYLKLDCKWLFVPF